MQNKIDFLPAEIKLLNDQEVILQKNTLLDKVQAKLDELGEACLKDYPQLRKVSPNCKVSKGENLKGFPFRVLDFPRLFGQEHILAIRTLVWWGKSYTMTLHLKGKHLESSLDHLPLLDLYSKDIEYKVSWHGNEWEHDLESNNYEPFSREKMEQYSSAAFLKIAVALPLEQLNELDHFYRLHFKKLISLTPYGK